MSTIETPTQQDIDQLTQQIRAAVPVRGTREAAAQSVLDTARNEFCTVWPQARQALSLLQTILGAIPGVSIFAKGAIGIVIAAGDAASSAICG